MGCILKNKIFFLFKRTDWWLLATISTQWLLISTTFLKVLPITNGFFLYWAKLSTSSVIYKDFFFPLPPVGLLVEGYVPRLFTDPLVAEQILQASKWLAIAAVLYLILVHLNFNKFASYVGTTVSVTAYYTSPLNITAGYLELAWLFLLLGVLFGIFASRDSRRWSPWLVSAATVFSLAFLTKQSAIFPCVAAIGILALIRRDSSKRAFSILSTFQVFLGASAPFFLFGIIGIVQGNLFEAISNISSGGGKNALGSLLPFVWLTSGLGFQSSWSPILAITFGLLLLSFRHKLSRRLESQLATALLGLGLTSLVIGILALMNIGPIGSESSQSVLLACVLTVGMVLGTSAYITEVRAKTPRAALKLWFLLPTATWVFISVGLVANLIDPTAVQWLPSYTQLNTVGGIASVGIGVAAVTSRKLSRSVDLRLLLTFSVAFGFAVTNAFSGNLNIETWLIGVALAIAWVLKVVSDSLNSISSKISISLMFLVVLVPLSASQSNNPYDWWGIREEPLTSQREISAVPSLAGFNLGTRQTQTYDELGYGLKKAIEAKGPNARILLGPNIAGLAGGVFPDLNTYHLKCPIIWWDLCSQDNTELDLNRVIQDPPEIIVWNIAPEAVAAGHEAGFNNGKPSSLRHMQDWILSQISVGYTQVNRFKVQAGDPAPSFTFEIVVLARNPL